MKNTIKTFLFFFIIGFSTQALSGEAPKLLGYYAKQTVKKSLWEYGVFQMPQLSKSQEPKKLSKQQQHKLMLNGARFQKLVNSL